MEKIDYAFSMKAMIGDISECGDIGFIKEYENHCFIALIDVLGHGAEARTIALHAAEYLEESYQNELIDIIKGLHEHLQGSRGAVVSLCNLDTESGVMQHVGIGNISVKILGTKSERLVSRDGIVGYGSIRPALQEIQLVPGNILLLHSDGIKDHFDPIECAGLFREPADSIVQGIMERYGNKNDDSSCVVLKYL